jgi:hypothetical protein
MAQRSVMASLAAIMGHSSLRLLQKYVHPYCGASAAGYETVRDEKAELKTEEGEGMIDSLGQIVISVPDGGQKVGHWIVSYCSSAHKIGLQNLKA